MSVKIVGILNITPDSFSDGGKFNSLDAAIIRLQEMMVEGADIIDIGAESTRPNAIKISDEEEWQRLEKFLPSIISKIKEFNSNNRREVLSSIDSYHFANIKKAHEMGVDIVNDVSGLIDDRTIDLIAQKNITTILMHNLAIHANPSLIVNPHINLLSEIISWAKEKIAYLQKKGVKKSQLIFDPGIGFAKNAEQSIRILKNIDALKVLDLPLYIGHSKKSFLDKISLDDFLQVNASDDCAQKTIMVSKYLIAKNVDFLRVHDVAQHASLVNGDASKATKQFH